MDSSIELIQLQYFIIICVYIYIYFLILAIRVVLIRKSTAINFRVLYHSTGCETRLEKFATTWKGKSIST